jgi:hypothetical protein
LAKTISSQGIKCCRDQQKKLDTRVSQAEVAGIYNSLASVYDIWGNLTESKARNRALELAGNELSLQQAAGYQVGFAMLRR